MRIIVSGCIFYADFERYPGILRKLQNKYELTSDPYIFSIICDFINYGDIELSCDIDKLLHDVNLYEIDDLKPIIETYYQNPIKIL